MNAPWASAAISEDELTHPHERLQRFSLNSAAGCEPALLVETEGLHLLLGEFT
jgi:hypothetical protein